MVTSPINIVDLKIGMTVLVNGQLITVSKNDIKYDKFMGYSFRGVCSKILTRVQFEVPTNLGVVLR